MITPLVRITLGRIGSTTLGRITLGRIDGYHDTDGGGGSSKGGLSVVGPDYNYIMTARKQDKQIIEIIIALNMGNLL